jgi:hypothetical protein
MITLEIAEIAGPLVDESAVEYGCLPRLPSAQFALLLKPTFVRDPLLLASLDL